jgi:biopolymer transport protein ExbD
MLSTTYSKFTELQLTLPVADTEQQRDRPKEIIVGVSADGRYSVSKQAWMTAASPLLPPPCPVRQQRAMTAWSSSVPMPTPHQSVVTVMEAARHAGLSQITFATQTSASAGKAN